MKRKTREIIAFVLTVSLLLGLAVGLGQLYMPERQDSGATWHKFLKEKEDSIDVLIVGSSLAYCDIIPAEIYRQTGHTSYVLAAPYMKMDVAYYYLKQALETQKPTVVLLEGSSLFFSDKEADFYKVNIGYMPFGINRLRATFDAPSKHRAGLLFPMYNYHSRWQEVPPQTYFRGRGDEEIDILAGYTALSEFKPQDRIGQRNFLADETEIETNFSYLEKIKALCGEQGITLELFIVPSCEQPNADCIEKLSQSGLPVTDFNKDFEKIGLDLATDFYDSRHLNLTGAAKYSRHLAAFIDQNFDLDAKPHNQTLWQKRMEYIDDCYTKNLL